MENESKARKMLRLTENKDFQELIIDAFIKDGVLEHTLQHNVRSEAVMDQLAARQILHQYIYDIITSGEMPE